MTHLDPRAAFVVAALSLGCARARGAPAQPPAMTRATYVSAEGSRELTVFRPSSVRGEKGARALVVMLHGCTQTADDMARGTRMNAVAQRDGFLVLYPEQSAAANPQKCWNWFVPEQTMRDQGEAALLAGLIDSVVRAEGVSGSRVSLVGMSAGAAMAANLAVAYPERFAALAMHSGIPARAAKDLMSGLTVMRQGATDGAALGAAALTAMGTRARGIPVIALHGSDDKIVSPANLAAIATQWMAVNAAAKGVPASVEVSMLPGVGHAWSGGSPNGTFTAPSGPDATKMIVEFLTKVGAIR